MSLGETLFLQQVQNSANVTLDVLLSQLSVNVGPIYTQANNAYGQANNAYNQANYALAVAEAAYGQANGAYGQANYGTSVAGSAYNQANNALYVAEQAYAKANTADSDAGNALYVAESAYGQANGAYNQANYGTSVAGSAYNEANSAYSLASSAYNAAESALAPSGVSPGGYGNGSLIPTFTVDARGRILGVTNQSISQFTSTGSGVVPASGGGYSNFLRSDGTWVPVLLNSSVGSNGYFQLYNGIYLIWGTATCSGVVIGENGPYTITYANSFPNGCFFVHLQFVLGYNTGTIASCAPLSSNPKSQAQFYTGYGQANMSNPTLYYFAIGY